MHRIFKIARGCSSKLPKQVAEFKEKEEKALQEIRDDLLEEEKEKLEMWFPDPNKAIEKRETPSYVSNFGKSDEEDTPAFFLEDLNAYQYIYTPKNPLVFDDQGYALIFKAAPRHFFSLHKLKYCWKIIIPVAFSSVITFQASLHSTWYIFLSWCIPFAIFTRALMVDQIYIQKDGKHAKFVYKRFKFLPYKEKKIDISIFKEISSFFS